MTTDQEAPRERAAEQGRRWRGCEVDLLFAAVVVASIIYWYDATSGIWFFADEWLMAEQVQRPRGLLQPYNGHLSLWILGIYRGLLEVVGFTAHGPYRLVGLLSFAAVAVSLYLTTRRRAGVLLAASGALVLLWPRDISLEPGGLNHSLTAVGAVLTAYGLRGRGSRRDLWVLGGLSFALGAAGGGVAVMAAALVHAVCSKASIRRWAAVIVPSAAWFLWRVVARPTEPDVVRAKSPAVLELARNAFGEVVGSFSSLTLGNRFGGAIVLIAFVLLALWRLRQGVAGAANVLAWTAALGTWWMGLEWTRWFGLEGRVFRYEFLAATFVLLAVQVSEPVAGDERSEPRSPWAERVSDLGRRTRSTLTIRPVAPALVAVLTVILVVAVRPDVERFATLNGNYGSVARSQVYAVGLDGAVPTDTVFGLNVGDLDAGQIRRLVDRFGAPEGYGVPEDSIREAAGFEVRGEARPSGCEPWTDAGREVSATVTLQLRAATDVTVEVRRFGSAWVAVGDLPEGRAGVLALPTIGSSAPWEVRAPGACVGGA